MRRGELVLSLVMLSMAACGGGNSNPDANLVHEADASPPDAGVPDAFVCTLTECGTECVDLQSDPLHCGDCVTECQSGASCLSGGCECPPSFLPATIANGIADQILSQLPGAYVALSPFIGAEIDAFGVAYSTAGVTPGEPYTLDGATLPATPFAIALFDIDINTMVPAGAFAAISGTLTFDVACASGASGTLTNAVFQAATVFPSPMIDPAGCTFDVPTVTFSIGTPLNCPVPALTSN